MSDYSLIMQEIEALMVLIDARISRIEESRDSLKRYLDRVRNSPERYDWPRVKRHYEDFCGALHLAANWEKK